MQNTYLHPKMFLSLTDPPAHHDCSLDARILAGVHDETMSRPERGGPLSCANLARLPGKKWCAILTCNSMGLLIFLKNNVPFTMKICQDKENFTLYLQENIVPPGSCGISGGGTFISRR